SGASAGAGCAVVLAGKFDGAAGGVVTGANVVDGTDVSGEALLVSDGCSGVCPAGVPCTRACVAVACGRGSARTVAVRRAGAVGVAACSAVVAGAGVGAVAVG